MVFTLHRYIFRELLKVFVPTAVALTVMVSLGMILQPVQKYGVGPEQVVHLMSYFLPVTLTFVLPMAALFAAALVYGRLANDNELDACKASGISLTTLVYPGLALAIIVATANLILSFYVMPVFVQRAEKSFKADAQKIIFRNIERKGYYRLGDGSYLIYADLVDQQNEMLAGVVITNVKDNKIERIITAKKARVHFNPHDRFNEVQITAYDVYQTGSEKKAGFSAKTLPLTYEFPSLMSDNIKFKQIDEMKKIQVDPMRFYPVARPAHEVYGQFIAELLTQDINERIIDTSGNFYKLYSGDKVIEFTADNCEPEDEKNIEMSGNVVVIEYDSAGKKLLRTLRCERAVLSLEGDYFAPTLTMEMDNPIWKRSDGSEGLASRVFLRGLILPEAVMRQFKTENVLETIKPERISAALKAGPSAKLTQLQNELWRKISRTAVKIKAEIHSRLVFGIGCISMIAIGIGLGIILRGGHLLTAFAASCIPAALLIVCIMMGKNLAKNPGAGVGTGITLMWAGLIGLSLLAVLIYRKLLRN